MRPFLFALSFSCCVLLCTSPLAAYTYNKATVAPLTVEIVKPAVMEKIDTPLTIKTLLKNAGETPIPVKLAYSSIETIEFEGAEPLAKETLNREETVPAKGEITVEINVIGTPGTLSTHYPIHLKVDFEKDGEPRQVAVVQPFESTITPNPNWPNANPMLGKLALTPAELPLNTIPRGAGLALAELSTYRVYWTWDKESKTTESTPGENQTSWKTILPHFLPVGWTGSEPTSAASLNRHSVDRGGQSRRAIQMHPTYRGGAGTVAAEYRIRLPEAKPITFSAFGAMRDLGPNEPPSDGVTFQVVAMPLDTPTFKREDLLGKKPVVDKLVVSRTWEALEGDLSAFAGKEIMLQLIADPGPKRNTTCDSCFWGDPTIFAGEKPTFADPATRAKQQAELLEECVATMKNGQPASVRAHVILPLEGGQRAVIVFGEYGFLDGKIAIGSPDAFVVYDGIQVAVKGAPLGDWPTTLAAGPWIPKTADTENGPPKPTKKPQPPPAEKSPLLPAPCSLLPSSEWAQEIAIGEERATMFYSIQANGPALQLSIDCSEPAWISRVQLGAANKALEAVYYGHGYRIIPGEKSFSIGAGGHGLSTSHVGMLYADLAVLHATTTPPVRFTVDPGRKIAALEIRPGTKLTLLPRPLGKSDEPDAMFECALRYRKINPLKAAPGVPAKLGRFCFDIWGGSYKRHTEIVENAIKYGLTDSLFINHVWQRYGYDNRLPDIWPPNERFGTLADMQETLRKCDEAGILYGLHDNYIDYYPDADEYGFDYISFEANGQPRKAWINEGIDARSYQFRPDRFAPFLKRNLDLMLPELPQSCYFVDVFASMPPIDFHDRDGNFHSRAETLQHWNQCFDTIRERLTAARRDSNKMNENFHAPSISEAGQDFLIGHLDGSDCQFMFLSDEPGRHRTYLPCKDWERVPWFDAVNHTNFSLHGVGYSDRYQAQRGRTLHGIESDDYITAEILTGHAAMVDLGSAMRGAVRKYWLLQPTLRELADCELASVTYVGGDMHRQKIVWKSRDGKRETIVYVNRGQSDWNLSPVIEMILPPFGCHVKGPAGEMSIARWGKNGEIAEVATCDSYGFFNGRQKQVEGLLPIRPTLKPDSFKYLGDNRFQCDVLWDAKAPAPQSYSIFVHLTPDDPEGKSGGEKIVGNYGCANPKPTSEWSGEVVTPMHPAAVDAKLPAGKYRLLVGLFDAKGTGQRAHLTGTDNDNRRYRIGTLTVARGDDGKITSITMEPEKEEPATPAETFEARLRERLVPPSEPLPFGIVETKGAFRWESEKNRNVITPLPDEPATGITIRSGDASLKVRAEDANGKKIRDVPATFADGKLTFTTKQGEFRYVIE